MLLFTAVSFNSLNAVCNHKQNVYRQFFQASNYVYTSHHHGLIPQQFFGTYDSLNTKLHDQFTIDEQGNAQGHFRRTGVLIY